LLSDLAGLWEASLQTVYSGGAQATR
jgi:hypothetical protein